MITVTEELFKKAQEKDPRAVTALFNMIFGVLIRTEITSSLKSEGEEADVALITLTKVFKEIGAYKFEGPENFAGWVHMIHRNSAKDWFRKKTARSSARSRHLSLDPPTTSKEPGNFVARDLLRAVWHFLHANDNPENCRIVFLNIAGYTDLEISQRLSKPIGTIKARLRRVRKKIREHLDS